ncbi:MAG: UDP-2,4-diacetamido-2,4,6-trideoxy-beta-L-altropyranose hydrolase [Elainellaceae cyanobacterium]
MNILIRADASVSVGTGHVMRCLALAQTFVDQGIQVRFAASEMTAALKKRLEAEGLLILMIEAAVGSKEDAEHTVHIAQHYQAAWIVVDGYQFGSDYQETIKSHGLKLLFLDDYCHCDRYSADIILNQNIYASTDLYPCRDSSSLFLLGTQYVLLRREFHAWLGWQRVIEKVPQKLLVTLGGSDPNNLTQVIIEAIQDTDFQLEAVIVVGGSNPYLRQLQEIAETSSHLIQLKHNVKNMSQLMEWADVAIASGGSTCWELAFMGLPSLLITLADNQRKNVHALDSLGIMKEISHKKGSLREAIIQGLKSIFSEEVRLDMSTKSQSLVDGQGVARVLRHLNEKESM